MKNILIDLTQIPRQKTGMGTYAINLLKHIATLDDKNKYTILVQDDEYSLDTIHKNNFSFLKVNHTIFRIFIFRILLEQLFIPFISMLKKFDIIHSLHYSFPILALRSNKIVTVPDLTFLKFPKLHIFVKRYYFRLFINLASKLAHQIICISRSTQNDLISLTGIKNDKISVIHLAKPDGDNFSIIPSDLEKITTRFHIQNDYILFLGMIEPRKNLEKLVTAFDRIHQDFPNYHLVIAGPKGWHMKSLFRLIDTLKSKEKFVFTGYITEEDKLALLENAKLFVYPSLYEGFGLPILEALSFGIPVITSNVSSMPEITDDAAILINPEKTDEIYGAIKRLLEDEYLYNSLKDKSIIQASKFTWEKTAKETIQEYENLLSR